MKTRMIKHRSVIALAAAFAAAGGFLLAMSRPAAPTADVTPVSQVRRGGDDEKKTFDDGFEFKREWTYARDSTQWRGIQRMIGKKAPEFEVGAWYNPTDGDKGEKLSKMKNDIVVIDFWGTWCPPCREAMPKTSEFAKKYADKGVEVVGICNTRGSDSMKSTGDRSGMKFPSAADKDDKTVKAYGVQWFPYYVVVDRDGYIRAAGVRPDKLEETVKELLVAQPKRDEDDSAGA